MDKTKTAKEKTYPVSCRVIAAVLKKLDEGSPLIRRSAVMTMVLTDWAAKKKGPKS